MKIERKKNIFTSKNLFLIFAFKNICETTKEIWKKNKYEVKIFLKTD